jgi:hypothetical protein
MDAGWLHDLPDHRDLEGIDSVSLSQRARFPAAFPSPAPPLSNLEKQATVSLVT